MPSGRIKSKIAKRATEKKKNGEPYPALPGQKFMLYMEMVPYGCDKLNDDWAWMCLGTYETEEQCVAVQEELMKLDDRFEHFCIMLNAEDKFPAPKNAAMQKARYKNQHMQEYHDDYVRNQNEVKDVMQRAATEFKNDPNSDLAGLLPMPTLDINGGNVSVTTASVESVESFMPSNLSHDDDDDEGFAGGGGGASSSSSV